MTNLKQQKVELRQKILRYNAEEFDEYDFKAHSQNIYEKVKKITDSLFKGFNQVAIDENKFHQTNRASSLGMYWPARGEPDILKLCLTTRWSLGLPKIENGEMKMVYYRAGAAIEPIYGGRISQPISTDIVTPKVMIFPALAYDVKGYRLGYGSGFLDKYIASKQKNGEKIILIGACFDHNLLEGIPIEPHDIKFDYIVTDKTIIKL